MDYAKYWQAVIARAWGRTWAVIVKKSLVDIVRDALLASIALSGAYLLQGWLVRVGALRTGNTFFAETGLTVAIGLLGLVALFALYFVGEALFVAPYALWREARTALVRERPAISLTIEIEPLKGQLHGSGERYYAVLTNNGDKTIEDVSLRSLESWFTQTIIHTALKGSSDSYRRPLEIPLKVADLHPDAPERIQLMGIGYLPPNSDSKDILNTVQRFAFEARGKDTKAVRVTFEYDPHTRPMIKIVK